MASNTDEIWIEPFPMSLYLHIRELKEFTPNTIVFDGYFRTEAKILPIRQLMYVRVPDPTIKFKCHLISIDSKEVLEDTSKGEYDEEFGGHICLFPTELIRLTYTILYTFKVGDEADREYHKRLCEELEREHEGLIGENMRLRAEREEEEYERDVRACASMKFI